MQAFTIVLTVLLLAGTGEAGGVDLKDVPQSGTSLCLDLDKSGHLKPVIISCDEMVNRKPLKIDIGTEPVPHNGCYQRMREAMMKAYGYIGYRESGMNIVPSLVMPEEDWKAWKNIYQECVK